MATEIEKDKIEWLINFRDRDKFCYQAWNERGLNRSSDEMCDELKALFYYTANELITAIESNKSKWKLKQILKGRLATFNKWNYDTEEKEFISDLFFELSQIIDVDFRDNLNKWLYGYVIITFMKVIQFFKPKKIEESIKQNCTRCNAVMETAFSRKENIPDEKWIIGRCGSCKEFNLFSHGPNIKSYSCINYIPEEYLPKEEFTYEQALTRLEQVKFFRK